MARTITDACVSCGTCEGECPVGAISEGDGKFEIDKDTCISCEGGYLRAEEVILAVIDERLLVLIFV